MFFIGEDFVLHRKKYSCTVYEVDNGESVFHCDFLCAEVFLGGDGEPSARFNGGIIGHNHTLFPAYISDTCNNAACWASALFRIHFIAGKGANFYPSAVFVAQIIDTFPAKHFAFFALLGCGFGATTLIYFLQFGFYRIPIKAVKVFVFIKFKIFGVHESSKLQN